MISFDRTIEITQKTVKEWVLFDKISKVTIIRDVFGKVALLLEMVTHDDKEINVTAEQNALLIQELEKKLGNYWQGKIYYNQECQNDIKRLMIQEIKNKRIDINEDENEKWYLLERGIAKKAWIDRNCIEKAIWTYDEAKNGDKPKVVTFYSFKGGMGRTTALAAVALCLCAKGKNVLMVDTDVEAPGLASLFQNKEGINKAGVVDYLLERNLHEGGIRMQDYIIPVSSDVLQEKNYGNIFMISSGKMDREYLQKLARIDFQDTIPGKLKENICQLIQEAIEAIQSRVKVDYVLLDARAGFHDMGGIVTTQIPHGVVVFSKDSEQSWQGTEQVIRAIGETQQDKPMLMIVDSACGQDGFVDSEEKQTFTDRCYDICCENYYESENQPSKDATDEPHTPVFVPYRPILMRGLALYTDGTEKQAERLQMLKNVLMGKEYQQIAERVMQWFGEGADSNE